MSESEISAFRDKLCQTAEHLFIEFGVDGFTMRRLASALGVSAMTPYRYFRNKSELLTAVRIQAFQKLAGALCNASQNTQAGNKPKTDTLCLTYIDFALGHSDQYQLMFSREAETAPVPDALKSTYQKCLDIIGQALKEDLTPASSPFPTQSVAFAYWSMLHGAVAVSNMLGKCDTSPLEELVLQTSHNFLRGLSSRTAEPAKAATQGRSAAKTPCQENV